MSEVRANSITNSAGTGAPDFPNGITAATIPAANLTGSLPAISGASLTNLPAPTSGQVGTATAGLTAGDVGSYAFMALSALSTSVITEGGTIAGSSLRYAGLTAADIAGRALYSTTPASTTVPSGTWKAMGSIQNTGNVYRSTLFLRIS